MKPLLIPLLLAGAGAGWFGLRPAPATEGGAPPCAARDCRVTVECTVRDTCIVTCYDANDELVCQREVACDEPCDRVCASPSEVGAQAGTTTAAGCPVPCAK